MAKTKIYSMASNDVVITKYLEQKGGTKALKIDKAIIIKGGANVAFSDNLKVKRNVKFAVTEVDDEELKILKSNPSFMRKVARGFISIGKEPQVLIADKSAQMTEDGAKKKVPKISSIKTTEPED